MSTSPHRPACWRRKTPPIRSSSFPPASRTCSSPPVLNAKGELIGLAFDGNWESMSSDVMFEPDLQRCICVDIRYVLWLVEKYGKADNIIGEITYVK